MAAVSYIVRMSKRRVYEWKISRISAKSVFVGYVEAADETAAIKTAIRKFDITNTWHQQRLVAQRRGEAHAA